MFYTYMPAAVDNTTVIPAAMLNYFRVNVGRAIDGTGGGTYTPSAVLNIQGSGFGTIDVATLLEVQVGGQSVDPLGAAIPDLPDNQTWALAQGQLRQFAATTAARDHDLSNVGATSGSWIHFIGLPGNVGPITIRRAGFAGNDVVVMPAAAWSYAVVYYDALGNWRLRRASANCTPGADA